LWGDYYRKNKKEKITDETVIETLSDNFSLEQHYIIKEHIALIIKTIDKLPLNQKRAVILYDFNNLSYIEGAQIMDITIAAYRNLLFRARTTLRKECELKNE
jgi:RNA polymerase sigma-70 factor (ECF subfamily)